MGNNQSYKNRALASLEGKWTNGIIATVIYLLITGCVLQVVWDKQAPSCSTALPAMVCLVSGGCSACLWNGVSQYIS